MGVSPNIGQDVAAATSGIQGGIAAGTAFGAMSASGITIASVGAATAGIGAGVVGIAMLLEQLFRGCGGACIEASEIEQIFEATGDNLGAAERRGWITQAEAVAAINALIQQGQIAYAKYPQLGSHGKAGLQNMTRVLQDEIQADMTVAGGTAQLPADYTGAFLQPGTQGWYASSLRQAMTLTQQITAQIVNMRSPISGLPVIGPVLDSLSASGASGLSAGTLVLIGIALIAWKVL